MNTTPNSCPRGLLSPDTRSHDGARVRASVGSSFTKASNLFVPVVSEVPSILIDIFPTVSFRKVVSLSQKASIIPTPENVLELEQEIDVSWGPCECVGIVHILKLNPLVPKSSCY